MATEATTPTTAADRAAKSLQDARDRAEETIRRAEREAAAIEKLGDITDGYCLPTIYSHADDDSISWSVQRYESIATGPSPDLALLRRLLDAFRPVPVVLIKDGCTSFTPVGSKSEQKDAAREGGPKAVSVWPVVVRVGGSGGEMFEAAEWWAVNGARFMKLRVELPRGTFGHASATAYTHGQYGPIACWENERYAPKDPAAKVITWGSGGREYRKSFSLYWTGPAPAELTPTGGL